MEALNKDKRYTYADYEKWDNFPRCELIDGIIYMMASPTEAHQWVSDEILVQLKNFLRGKTCRAYSAPFDVRLNWDTSDDVVVQPDVLVVCDRSKVEDGKNCKGAPDFVVEVLSPSTSNHDVTTKLGKYLHAKVPEYWVVNTESRMVVAHRLVDDHYITTIYNAEAQVPVTALEGCTINLQEVFEEMLHDNESQETKHPEIQ